MSFSLIYNNGKRSVDLVSDELCNSMYNYDDILFLFSSFSIIVIFSFVLFQICKDKVEVEVWIAGLRALISSGQAGRSKIDGWSDGGFNLDVNTPNCCLCS